MKRVLLAALALSAATSCNGSNFNPMRYGTVSVAFDGPVTDPQRAMFDTTLDVLGPDFVATTAPLPDVKIIVDTELAPGRPCTMRLVRTERVVRLSHPACFTTDTGARAAIAHALGHWSLMTHVCRQMGDASDCSPVGYGRAVMNGGTITTNADGSLIEEFPGHDVFTPTGLDIEEFRRTHP